MKTTLLFTEQDFLSLIKLSNPTYIEFCEQIQILNISDTTGTFAAKQDLDSFIERVAKKDNRKERLELYKQKLYRILVVDAKQTLIEWYKRTSALKESIEFYFDIPNTNILEGDIFAGRTNSKYGRICKNINFTDFYNTKKHYALDSQYTFGLIKVMFEDFKLRNSLVGPAFFDHICKYDGDSGQFWMDFMIGANRASIFNPATYKGILDTVFTGDTLFAPVMGWNAYQLGFYSSNFKKFIATDVMPNVVNNGQLLHTAYNKYKDTSLFEVAAKEVDLYLCPSEQLDIRHSFISKYINQVDAVLLSPPYFDLEIYPSADQSIDNFSDYNSWLIGYWEATIKISKAVMKPGARLGFVISNYRNKDKQEVNISQDMRDVVSKHLKFVKHYRVQWSAISGSRQAKKTRDGNFEDLWVFEK